MGNPSLANLIAVAESLGVGLDELTSRPRSAVMLVRANDVPVEQRARGGGVSVQIRKLLPDQVRGLAFDEMKFSARARMAGKPHLPGAKEYLVLLKGKLEIGVDGERWELDVGDVLAFPGDVPHAYVNSRETEAIAISVVIPL